MLSIESSNYPLILVWEDTLIVSVLSLHLDYIITPPNFLYQLPLPDLHLHSIACNYADTTGASITIKKSNISELVYVGNSAGIII